MNSHQLCLKLALVLWPAMAAAGQGLVAPEAASLWPQWQARIAVQTAVLQPVSLVHSPDGGSPTRLWQGAALLGDYLFATPAFGSFRASGGLLTGNQGGVPLLNATAGPRLGLTLRSGGHVLQPGADLPGTVPYLGLGFTGAAWHQSLSVTADLGLVAEGAGAAGRAIFGNQGMEGAMRELRLSPLLQLGVRYAF